MSRDPQVGDLVDITIKGARVTDGVSHEHMQGRSFVARTVGHVGTYTFVVCPDVPAVAVQVVERAMPAKWPPCPGDIWRDKDNDLWFAHRERDDIVLTNTEGWVTSPTDVHSTWGPLALVRREQTVEGDDSPATWPPPPANWPPRAGDVWRDQDGDDWTAVNDVLCEGLCLHGQGIPRSVEEVRNDYGPLTLVSREQTAL
ncbi:hypothetical protein E1295_47005 [Nonomuraea mesophila]|uniref:Uncharacterized protein n=1 Tax=Nonomuraea mesophila TaxID=2530382 RepID=A0A4R5DZY7_9ACTN|nr:hypothetical protein [Nonomuraea mesophila]TDE20853.1 hypothetical protein E1295_47005 [Nonomuraea mesophila]